jgi:carotenoid cleavage dioxygenase-like enzyme
VSISSRRSIAPPTSKPAWWSAVGETAREFDPVRLRLIAGTIPAGLRGTLYRNGAARLERGRLRCGHWFDGDGAIAAIRFETDQQTGEPIATATQKFVQTTGYRDEERAGKLLYGNYGTMASGAFWNRWRRPVKHSANTSVMALPDRLLALWEGGAPYALDLDTLATQGLDTTIAPSSYSAHPKRDPHSGEIYNFGVTIGAKTKLTLYRHRADGQPLAQREHPIADLGLSGLPVLHDFVMAGRYLVFFVPPVAANPLEIVAGLKTYSDSMTWYGDRATTILVFDRETLELVSRSEADPWFQWHFANGFEDEAGRVVVDVVRYDDFTTNEFLRQVSQGAIATETSARLERVTIDPASGRDLGSETRIERHCEFPIVAPEAVGTDADRIFVVTRRPEGQPFGDLFGAIGCYDVAGDQLTVLDCGDRVYPSEPIFVPGAVADSGNSGDRDSWLIFPVFVADEQRSEVWIVSADRVEAGAVCRLALPEIVPIGFHGTWQASHSPRKSGSRDD